MNRNLLPFLLLLLGISWMQAQSPPYQKIKAALAAAYPGAQLDDKVIMYQIFSVEDMESREAVKILNKTGVTFRVAKLRGGGKGLVTVAIALGSSRSTAITTLTYDGVEQIFVLDAESLGREMKGAALSGVFDSQGNELFHDLAPGQFFGSINSLITR